MTLSHGCCFQGSLSVSVNSTYHVVSFTYSPKTSSNVSRKTSLPGTSARSLCESYASAVHTLPLCTWVFGLLFSYCFQDFLFVFPSPGVGPSTLLLSAIHPWLQIPFVLQIWEALDHCFFNNFFLSLLSSPPQTPIENSLTSLTYFNRYLRFCSFFL